MLLRLPSPTAEQTNSLVANCDECRMLLSKLPGRLEGPSLSSAQTPPQSRCMKATSWFALPRQAIAMSSAAVAEAFGVDRKD